MRGSLAPSATSTILDDGEEAAFLVRARERAARVDAAREAALTRLLGRNETSVWTSCVRALSTFGEPHLRRGPTLLSYIISCQFVSTLLYGGELTVEFRGVARLRSFEVSGATSGDLDVLSMDFKAAGIQACFLVPVVFCLHCLLSCGVSNVEKRDAMHAQWEEYLATDGLVRADAKTSFCTVDVRRAEHAAAAACRTYLVGPVWPHAPVGAEQTTPASCPPFETRMNTGSASQSVVSHTTQLSEEVVAPPGDLDVVFVARGEIGHIVDRIGDGSAVSGRLLPGDRIVMVNGQYTETCDHAQITALLDEMADRERKLVVSRPAASARAPEEEPSPLPAHARTLDSDAEIDEQRLDADAETDSIRQPVATQSPTQPPSGHDPRTSGGARTKQDLEAYLGKIRAHASALLRATGGLSDDDRGMDVLTDPDEEVRLTRAVSSPASSCRPCHRRFKVHAQQSQHAQSQQRSFETSRALLGGLSPTSALELIHEQRLVALLSFRWQRLAHAVFLARPAPPPFLVERRAFLSVCSLIACATYLACSTGYILCAWWWSVLLLCGVCLFPFSFQHSFRSSHAQPFAIKTLEQAGRRSRRQYRILVSSRPSSFFCECWGGVWSGMPSACCSRSTRKWRPRWHSADLSARTSSTELLMRCCARGASSTRLVSWQTPQQQRYWRRPPPKQKKQKNRRKRLVGMLLPTPLRKTTRKSTCSQIWRKRSTMYLL